jgi:hypothetical protein
MTMDVRDVSCGTTTRQLIAIMVKPLPCRDDVSEYDLLIDLLRNPAVIFGPMGRQGGADATCRHTTWEGLGQPLEFFWKTGISPRHLQHLLLLAGHFAQRHALQRSGTAVLSLYDEDVMTSFRYDIPMQLSREKAQEWTMAFWNELGSVDLMKSNFLIVFTEASMQPDPSASVSSA